MRGKIASWKDDRGFGFIEPGLGGERVFFHITGLRRGMPRPEVGDLVSYEVATTQDGKVRAVNIGPVGLAAVSNSLASKRAALSVLALLVFPALWWLVAKGKLPLPVFWGFIALSFAAFTMYGLDKLAAIRDAKRTPENTLQLFALLGGWPGALLAQQIFRHKSSKRSFQVTFWLMVAINCGAIGFAMSPQGAAMIHQVMQAR